VVGANARETLLVAKVANRAGKDTRKGDRHKDVEARRAYMREYMRKRRAARFRLDTTTAAIKTLPPTRRRSASSGYGSEADQSPMGPLLADFVVAAS
jgi:hypothetical protein